MKYTFLLALLLPAQGRDVTLDAWFEGEWKRLNLKPAAPAEDAAFLRRVSLDLTGYLPEPDEVRAFLKSPKKEKRAAKIEELVSSPKAAEYFAHTWVQWLTGHDVDFADTQRMDVGALTRWLKEAWDKDRPYDELVTDFLSARGSPTDHPATNFLLKHLVPGDPPAAAAVHTARLFLGRDIKCAQCHDHPFETTTHEEFWGFAALFRSLRPSRQGLADGPVAKPDALRDDMGEQFETPRFLDGREPEPDEPPAKALPRLLLSAEGDAVARAVVDRTWKLLFGRSIAPHRSSKGRPELLDLLVRGFVKNGWSLKKLVRMVVSSRAYQLSSEGADAARREYAAGPLKMMNTVQFLRTFHDSLQLEEYFRRLYERDPSKAPYFRDPDAFWIGLSMWAKEMIFPKGRDPEESLAQGTDRLALKLMNNRDIQLWMVANFPEAKVQGHVRRIMKETSDPGKRIEELFLLLVSRPPTRAEKSQLVEYVKGVTNPYHAFADVFWMLFNSSEFIFIG